MPHLLWDASGLTKRYYGEAGTPTVNALFAPVPTPTMAIAYIGYAETAAVLRRKHNQGSLATTDFTQSRVLLRNQVLISPAFTLLPVEDADFLVGSGLTDRHNINASDAAILSAYLRYSQAQPPGAPRCLLVASDQRLIRAAGAEGLPTLNPDAVPPADLPAFLAGIP